MKLKRQRQIAGPWKRNQFESSLRDAKGNFIAQILFHPRDGYRYWVNVSSPQPTHSGGAGDRHDAMKKVQRILEKFNILIITDKQRWML